MIAQRGGVNIPPIVPSGAWEPPCKPSRGRERRYPQAIGVDLPLQLRNARDRRLPIKDMEQREEGIALRRRRGSSGSRAGRPSSCVRIRRGGGVQIRVLRQYPFTVPFENVLVGRRM